MKRPPYEGSQLMRRCDGSDTEWLPTWELREDFDEGHVSTWWEDTAKPRNFHLKQYHAGGFRFRCAVCREEWTDLVSGALLIAYPPERIRELFSNTASLLSVLKP